MAEAVEDVAIQVDSETSKMIGSVILGILGLSIAAGGSRFKGRTVFAVGALLAGSISFSGVLPNIIGSSDPVNADTPSPILALGYLVVIFGALIGGVFAHLFSKQALGLSMGFASVILLLLIEGGSAFSRTAGSAIILSTLFVLVSCLGWALAERNVNLAGLITTSIIGALLIVCAIDLGAKSLLLMDLNALLTFQWESIGNCPDGNCHGFVTLLLWFGLAMAAFSVQAYRTDEAQIRLWLNSIFNRNSTAYSTIPGERRPVATKESSGRPEHQRSDSNIFSNFSGGPRTTNVIDLSLPDESGQQAPPTLDTMKQEEKALLQVLANMYEDITALFGFQVDNALNQVEHLVLLLLNHKRFAAEQYQKTLPARDFRDEFYKNPINTLHEKMFKNYKRWVVAVGAESKLMQYPDSNTGLTRSNSQTGPRGWWFEEEQAKKKLNDLLLQFLIWGEAGNLRHMPECLTFLFHKMADCYSKCVGTQVEMRQPGHFLGHTVTPIYLVVAKEMGRRADHVERRNYDDFNEFFWKHECLDYGFEKGQGKELPVSQGLANTPKSFLEKRSWLGIMLAFRRLLDWHIITFHILVVVAFWSLLMWEYPYALQLMSSAFLTLNFLGIFWVCLEVWSTVAPPSPYTPAIQLKPEEVWGFIVRLSARFVFLVYQAIFYSLSLKDDGLSLNPSVTLADKSEQLFNWWQYVWVSLMLLSLWLLDCFFQIFPSFSTKVFTSERPYFRAVVDLIFPQGRNYTGKRVHETFWNAIFYMFFWATLVAWKLYFSYSFEVGPIALPSLELSDDLVNYLDQSVVRTTVLIIIRWLPFAAIYMLDMLIWYSMWAGLAGLWVGLEEKLGQIRDFTDIRSNFMRTPEGFFSRLVFMQEDNIPMDLPKKGRRLSTASDLKMPRVYSSSKHDLVAAAAEESTPLVSNSNGSINPPRLYHSMSSGGDFLEVATSKWKLFATAWNKIVENLRRTDVISNDERDMLKFGFFDDLSKPIYLPVFQTAGSVERAVNLCQEKGSQFRNLDVVSQTRESQAKAKKDIEDGLFEALKSDVTVLEAVSETLELGMYFLTHLLGVQHEVDVRVIKDKYESMVQGDDAGNDLEQGQGGRRRSASSDNSCLLDSIKLEEIGKLVPHMGSMVSNLKGGLSKRVIKPRVRRPTATPSQSKPSGGLVAVGMKKSRSAGFLGSLSNLELAGGDQQSAYVEAEIDSLRDKVRDSLRAFLTGLKSMCVPNKGFNPVIEAITNILTDESGFLSDDYTAAVALDKLAAPEVRSKVQPILAKLSGLLLLHVADAEPQSQEARRRLTFFVNSLFMDLPKAPSIHHMMSWTVVTPYYSEDVLYSRKDLDAANTDGVNTMLYLQTLYKSDWNNFKERLGVHDENMWHPKYREETRLWASLRAQTLARTVQGMMYYEEALKLLVELDREKKGNEANETIIQQKFGYVVACQVYGKMKKNQDSKAEDIEKLLYSFPNLRVAYIDEVRSKSGDVNYYSVLIRGNVAKGKGVDEIYRVKLPGNPVLGEGKPENQNHAVIFTRGEHVQAIDMNQEGYFEDAFKFRNFLQEFAVKDQDIPTTILGFREHIFTGAVSSLANYMALQEYSFVTLGQRVLNKPLRMRLHYGHPDVFDKLFFMQNGGVSKASKGINLSEDIFAGYNNLLRGGSVEFKEYVQVGKGRDVGMQQIYKFEAKLSQGAAEQSISRDVYRMLNRVDFFRLMSFYFGGIGHYLSSVLTVLAIWLMVYLMLGLALFEDEKIGDRPIIPEGLLQLVLAGVGILQTVPLFCTLVLERGIWASLMEIAQVFLSGGPIYFIFHIRTRDYYYTQTVLAGGAAYRATGRGFVTHHSPFDENYRFFANSHFYLGFEIAVALVLLAIYSSVDQYAGRTWSLWIAALSFLFAPFWFNPMTFEWERVRDDYYKWTLWMSTTGGSSLNSWDTWWKEENGYITKLSFGSKAYTVCRAGIYLVVAYGLIYKPLVLDGKTKEWYFVLGHILFLLAALVAQQLMDSNAYRMRNFRHQYIIIRSSKMFLGLVVLILVISIIANNPGNFVYILALYYMMGFVATLGWVLGFAQVRQLYRLHDLVMGHCLFIPLFFFSALQFPRHIQTWLLYHNALSQGVVISDMIRYAQKSRGEAQGGSSKGDSETQSQAAPIVAPPSSTLGMGSSEQSRGSGANLARRPSNEPRPTGEAQAARQPATGPSADAFMFKQPDKFPARS